MSRIEDYIAYHYNSSLALDIDPQNEAINYICNRFELNIEQRLWLCFLFSTNYCVPTTYFMYNEFPDYQTVDIGRLQRWWDDNRAKLIFQTDRAWIRSRNQFIGVFESYRNFVQEWSNGSNMQLDAINAILKDGKTPAQKYELLVKRFNVSQFGRFTMFLYSELLKNIGGVDIGVDFDIREAESSRNGLAFALGMDDAYTGRSGRQLDNSTIDILNSGLRHIVERIDELPINNRHKTLWSVETTLCAYKKYVLNRKRWVGYYIERMRREIIKLESTTNRRAGGGVSWLPLWQFRTETYNPQFLLELK